MNPGKLITIFLIAVMLLFAFLVWWQKITPVVFETVRSEEWTTERNEFHGTGISICNDKGECWFWRNGVKCKL
jgi:hypothetical protein